MMSKRNRRNGPTREPAFLSQSIEALEHVRWPEPDHGSYVVKTSYALRRKPLNDLTDEELRLALSQQLGLPWVLSLALLRLEANPLRSGDFYPGDILLAALRLPASVWAEHTSAKDGMRRIVELATARLNEQDDDEQPDLRAGLKNFQ